MWTLNKPTASLSAAISALVWMAVLLNPFKCFPFFLLPEFVSSVNRYGRQLHLMCWRRLRKKKLQLLALVVFVVFLVHGFRAGNNCVNSLDHRDGHPLDCKLLASYDSSELVLAELSLRRRKCLPPTPDSHLIRTIPCEEFIRERGYEMKALSVEEQDFPLAFSMRMHANVAQAERLLRAIYRPQNVYCIHIDRASSPIIQTAMRSIISCFPNMFMSSLNEEFVYESFSPVEADLQCVRQLLASRVAWKYYLNLAGTEFPLRTNLELVRVLKRLNGTNDIEMDEFPDYLMFRITSHHFVFSRRLYRNWFAWKDPFRHRNVTIYKGNSYNMFSRDFIVWMRSDRIAQELIDWSRDTHSPDETVWATMNGMSGAPGGYTVNSSSHHQTFLTRAVLWGGPDDGNHTCQGAIVHDICVFGYRDLKWLASRQQMLANKFNVNDDPVAYECLEEALRERVRNPEPDHSIDWEFVQKSLDTRQLDGS